MSSRIGWVLASLLAAALFAPAEETAPLGTNLAWIGGNEIPFADAFKTSSPWVSGSTGVWNDGRALDLDARGWVRSLQAGQVARTWMFGRPGTVYPSGEYIVEYEGRGTLAYGGAASLLSSAAGRDTLTVDASLGPIYLYLTSLDLADPLRNLRVWIPGSVEGTYFRSAFVDRIRAFRSLRFSQWMLGERMQVRQVEWSARPLVDDARWGDRGVPLEVMVTLANHLGVDPWFCLPHEVSDDYVLQFAQTVGSTLAAGLRAHVEYSNEVWRTGLPPAAFAEATGLALGLDPSPTLARLRYYSLRSRQVFGVCESVLPADRLVRVLSTQTWSTSTSEVLLSYSDTLAHVDALAVAPFFQYYPSEQEGVRGLSLDQVMGDVSTLLVPRALALAQSQIDVAGRYGLPMIAYAGGQDLRATGTLTQDATLNALFDSANRDARMRDAYTAYLEGWRALGGGLFMHYLDCAAYAPSGRNGAIEWIDQPRAEAPKYDALMSYIESSAPAPASLPVLMVIANVNFHFTEYTEPRRVLEAAGHRVVVAAGSLSTCVPHPNTGQAIGEDGSVEPDVELISASAADYSAIVFVGGWGASSYQYDFPGTYDLPAYNGDAATKQAVNTLIVEFMMQGKFVTAICHGVTILAWARVNGPSPIAGHSVCGYREGGPACSVYGQRYANNVLPSRWHNETNGATQFEPDSVGLAGDSSDDVYVDGQLITAQDSGAAERFGQVLVEQLAR